MYTAGSQGGTDVSVEEPEDRPHARVTTELHGDAMQRLVRTAIDDKGPLLQPSPEHRPNEYCTPQTVARAVPGRSRRDRPDLDQST